jgi:hypothetical protein
MAYEVHELTVNLLQDTASVGLRKEEGSQWSYVSITVPIETPGNQPEHRLQQIAKAAAKQALLDAANAL